MHSISITILNGTTLFIAILFLSSFFSVISYFAQVLAEGLIADQHDISIVATSLGKVAIPITNLTTTFMTFIYSYCFYMTSKPSNYSSQTKIDDDEKDENMEIMNNVEYMRTLAIIFFDFDLDGRIGLLDIFACVSGTINNVILVVDMLLWYGGILSTSKIITTLASMNRVITLFITRSYMIPVTDLTKESPFNTSNNNNKSKRKWIVNILKQLTDINNDGLFQFVDVISFSASGIYMCIVITCWTVLISSELGKSDINSCVSFANSLTTPLATIFGCSLLLQDKQSPLPFIKELWISFCCVCYVIFLIRVIIEIYLQNKYSFDLMSTLSNGLVLPVVQLMSAFLVHRKQDTTTMKSTIRNSLQSSSSASAMKKE